ncbi:MAG: hypothetical protein KDA68_08920 [Planctomycetaceae bacterium]|nr:hypothetical protein [Planctomycetaceae bacterium]
MKEFRLDEIPEGRGLLMASRILVFALAMGVVVFGGVAAGVVFMGPKDAADVGLPIVSYVMAALAVITLMMSFVIPAVVVAQMRRQVGELSPEKRPVALMPAFQTKTLLGCASCEGGAFGNLIAFISEQQIWTFGIAGVLLLVILSRFPTEAGIENFVQRELEMIELDQGRRD